MSKRYDLMRKDKLMLILFYVNLIVKIINICAHILKLLFYLTSLDQS